MSVQTSAYPSGLTGSFSVLPEMGKVHFSWSKAIQPGPLDYVIHILTDPSEAIPYQEIITRDTEVRDLVLPAGQSYWLCSALLQLKITIPLPPLKKSLFNSRFQVTIYPLQNLTAIDRNGTQKSNGLHF